ncbi:phosphatidylethanolamine-binding protein 4 isoform X3 [Falco naumanni]|uniref:phosphatidylethanolamine-binding protein 4 isoform X3 n=1 Tax=Falco naumanni TaxID=148594 RepID=UPI001ADE7874|nr:phosphatidylethanolamine-binding protein 4 isoform X3 [Falco naumanni]
MFEPVITSKFCKSLAISPTVCGRKESRRCQPGETISTATSSLQALPPGCSPIPRTQRGRMKLLGAVLLAAGLLSTAAGREQPPWPDEPSKTCFFQTLSSVDSEFCRGDLEIIYPELGDVGCTYIPKCHQYRRRISREWGSPRVRYPQAEEGADLRTGDIQGRVLTAYVRPTPPPRSGYHRYQLRLYEQPAHEAIALSPEERVSLGAWALENFVEQFRLGSPVASTQFLTKYHED